MPRLQGYLILVGAVGQVLAYSAGTCPSQIPENERSDCYPEAGASEASCNSRGCMWCETADYQNPQGYPWCFYDGDSSVTQPPSSSECVDCSCTNKVDCYPEPGSSESGCIAKGCLWCESQIPNEPWCFYGSGGSPSTPNPGGDGEGCSSCTCSNKVDCYPEAGSSEAGCYSRGCLWCPANNGDPWCIYSDGTTLPPSTDGCQTTIPESQRIDCWPGGGASEGGCEEAGCIWCESSTNGVPWCFFNTTDLPPGIPDDQRINCIPEGGFSPSECESRGCLFASVESSAAPMCYFPDTYGYQMVGDPVETATGYEITLQRVSTGSLYGDDSDSLLMTIDFDTDYRIHWKFTDANNPTRFEVPIDIVGGGDVKASNPLYEIIFNNDPTFSFKIIRKSSGAVLWDTSLGGLTFSDQFLQIATYVPEDLTVYGFGETEHSKLKHSFDWSAWGMYARDQPPAGVGNLYGVHPFYIGIENDFSTHGVLFFNAAAQDITFTPAPGLLYRTIGGVLDFYMFLGPEPNTVIEQYNQAIGTPFLPPYWSLGFQLCRYGYGSLAKVQETVSRMDAYGIPLDVQYGDIDYMDEQRDFTIHPTNYVGLPQYVEELHASGKHYVIILDPCLTADDPPGAYPPYDRGVTADAYVKNEDGTYALGKVWPPGDSVFPDYSKPSCQTWWENECALFHDTLKFDGIWIDMNEPANFVTGSTSGCSNNKLNYPPYHPLIWGDVLADKTLCPDMLHHAGTHYDTHSLYGYFESVTTYHTFPGSGNYSAHWLGDNNSDWHDLKNSIIGMLEFNLFGIPYVGADICGFNGNVNEELCARWMELGSFYPYARNHNGLGYSEQDPAAFGDAFAENVKKTLEIRYTLLPYLYTLFYDANVKGIGVVRPLSFEFTSDTATHAIDEQFLWGAEVLFSPVVYEGETTVNAYFPDARWYAYRNGQEVTTRGGFETLSAPIGEIPIHIRGGYVIPTQEPDVNTVKSTKNPFGLIIALDDEGKASGSLFWDALDVIDTIKNNDFVLLEFDVANGALTTTRTSSNAFDTDSMHLGSLRIFGVTTSPPSVKVNGVSQTFTYSNNVVEVANISGQQISETLDIVWV